MCPTDVEIFKKHAGVCVCVNECIYLYKYICVVDIVEIFEKPVGGFVCV